MQRYNPNEIEPKWQKIWADKDLYKAIDFDTKPKYIMLTEFPYPSGDGLHLGHIREYTYGDIIARYKRMKGYNVMYPMGYDAFGLPTENYAIKNNISPEEATEKNIATFQKQFEALGYSIDWSRSFRTTDPSYYKWTQWLFLQFFKAGLAYQSEIAINWCPHCKTGLANEEVINGRHERCDTIVEKKVLKQWLLKITDYADRLIDGLKSVDYPSRISDQQINWIGRSEGAEIAFKTDTEANYVLLHGFTASSNDDFFPWLKTKLSSDAGNIYVPDLPNTDKPDADEQANFVLSNTKFDENTVLLGHSYGSVAALKILEKLEKPIAKLVLVAPFAQPGFLDKERNFEASTNWQFDFEKIKKNAKEIVILRAKNDSAVPQERSNFLKEKLGGEIIDFTAQADHACGTEEPVVFSNLTSSIQVFTTRPDTLFGASFVVLAPEQSLVKKLTKPDHKDRVNSYIKMAQSKTEIERLSEDREKTGVFTGRYAVNPINNQRVPIWIADYVMAGYGTGAIMAVPAHDERDWEFAKKYDLPIIKVIDGGQDESTSYSGEGRLINSGDFSGQDSKEAKQGITEFLEKQGVGSARIQYKLRDWIFSRQRYWGEPIPIIHCPKDGPVAVPDDQLPVVLPPVDTYDPTASGQSPLALNEAWVNVTCPKCGSPAKRETDTMPNWAGSSWYYLRYYDANNDKEFASKDKLNYWGAVDFYLGGMEHTTLHLLYSRFWHQFLYDQKLVPTPEPYQARRGQGIILAADGSKMSKSKGNVVNPSDIIDSGYGADALRLSISFLAPYDQTTPWSPEGVAGTHRFLQRLWTLAQEYVEAKKDEQKDSPELKQIINKAIKKVGDDLEKLNFNTAIAALMDSLNQLYLLKAKDNFNSSDWAWALTNFVQLLAPYAPHIAEELWQLLGNKEGLSIKQWPEFDEKYLITSTVNIVIQVNGKLRGEVELPRDVNEEEAINKAKSLDKIQEYIGGKELKRTVYVPSKLVNFVI